MAVNDQYDKGPTHGAEAQGYSAAYEADRARALAAQKACMAGPDAVPPDPGAKNPDREFEAPAPMPEGAPTPYPSGPGPNAAGNSKGDGTIDPQGQQGGTEGGQPGDPSVIVGEREAGTPLRAPDERDNRRPEEKGPRPIPP
jgi:hypothetical protein